MVDHLDRRRRVVDGRRECSDRDVDEDPEGERRVLVDRPLDPERESAGKPALRNAREGCVDPCTSSRTAFDETKSPTPWRITMTASLRVAQASRPFVVDRLERARLAAPDDERGRAAEDLLELGVRAGATARARELDRLAEGLPSGVRHERGHLDGPQAMDAAVEKDEKEDEAGADEEPGHRDAEVGHRLVDPAEERVREGERPDENGERRLEHAVAVPESHVAGREGPGRHLHDENRSP